MHAPTFPGMIWLVFQMLRRYCMRFACSRNYFRRVFLKDAENFQRRKLPCPWVPLPFPANSYSIIAECCYTAHPELAKLRWPKLLPLRCVGHSYKLTQPVFWANGLASPKRLWWICSNQRRYGFVVNDIDVYSNFPSIVSRHKHFRTTRLPLCSLTRLTA